MIPLHSSSPERRGVVLKTCLLVLLVLAGKWVLIDRFAGDVPFADQWSAEGEAVYAPMMRSEWTWDRLFHAWNEHRIVPSRMLSILLFKVTGGQWDPTVELVASALVHALLLGALGGWLMRSSLPRWHPWICLFVVAVGVLPFAYENTLWGFQSSFYFLLFFSLLGGWGLLGATSPKRIRWWIGLVAGFIAVFSLGSGGLVGAAILPVLGLRMLKRRKVSFFDVTTALVAVAIVFAGWAIRVTVVGHVRLAPGSWADFCVAAWRLLAWPFPGAMPAALIVWMPLGILLFNLLRSRSTRLGPLSEAAIFLAGWALLQMMAIAWLRGALLASSPPSSRYQDILAIGLAANLAAIISLDAWTKRSGHRFRLVAPVWAFFAGVGLIALSAEVATDLLGPWRQARRLETDRLAFFLRVGDNAALKDVERWDRPALLIKTWSGQLASALPPSLQARPPVGFGFLPVGDWDEGAFGGGIGAPGGYAGWGNGVAGQLPTGQIDVTSTPFLLRRGAVAFSYAISSQPGFCLLEFLNRDGSVAADFSVYSTAEKLPAWWEASLRIPPGEYRLRVFDNREGGRFAVTAPREMSGVGFFVRQCLGQSNWLVIGAGLGLMLCLFHPARPVSSEK